MASLLLDRGQNARCASIGSNRVFLDQPRTMDNLNDIISAILLITGGLIAIAAIPILLLAVVIWTVSGIAWVFHCDAEKLLNAMIVIAILVGGGWLAWMFLSDPIWFIQTWFKYHWGQPPE